MTSFEKQCYQILSLVPSGHITTYAEIAKAIGNKKSYRAVGNAMNKNPNAPIIPCHRVIKTNGDIGGFAFGINKKIKILQAEGINIKNGKIVNFKKYLYKFNQ